MDMHKAFTGFLCFLSSIISFPVSGQNNVLQFQSIQLPGSFPAAGIRMAVQDEAGLLWYTTSNGLQRFDGHEVLRFGLKTQPGLPYVPLYYIKPDGHGNLWLGYFGGAARFDLKTWAITPLYAKDWHHSAPLDQNMSAIGIVDGRIYFGARSGKLYFVDKDSLQLVTTVSASITSIAEPVKGQLWLTTDEGHLVYTAIKNGHYTSPLYYKFTEANNNGVYNICYDSSGNFLCSAGIGGLIAGDVKLLSARKALASSGPNGAPVSGLVKMLTTPEPDADLYHSPFYIGARPAILTGGKEQPKRIYTFNFKTMSWDPATPSGPFKFPGYITYLSPCPGGTLISSSEGLTRISFHHLPATPLLNAHDGTNSIRSIYKNDSLLYVGSYEQGFIIYNERTGKSQTIDPGMRAYSILSWGKDSLLLADEGTGLFWYSVGTKSLAILPVKNLSRKRMENMATVLCKINDTLVLEGTYRGVQVINPLKGYCYPALEDSLALVMQDLKVDAIMSLNKTGHPGLGKYLVGTSGGTFIVDMDGGTVRYLLADSVQEKTRQAMVFGLLKIGTQIWMGSSGLGVLAADTSGNLIPMDWLNSRLMGQMAYSLARCGDEVLIGTDKGLNVVHLRDSSINYYTTHDGLPGEEFNQAAVFANDHETYLGTTNGIIRWPNNQDSIQKPIRPFTVHINKLIVADKGNHEMATYNLSYLPPPKQTITIPSTARYFALSFGRPTEISKSSDYAYRLGPKEDWVPLGRKREITFVHTQPGHYMLQFATKAPGGLWVAAQRLIPLIIKPAFYETTWFKVLLALLFVAIVLLVFRYREIQHRKERNLRMKIAGDLHDEVGSALSTIWHQVQQASPSDTPETTNTAKPLRALAEISQRAMSVMNDIVWSLDARFDTMEEFVMRTRDFVYKLQNELGVPIVLEISGRYQNRKLSQVVRQNLFLLFKEAVNNALKHGHGGQIMVQLTFAEKLTLIVSNPYKAEKAQHQHQHPLQGGRGLPSMRRRAEHMHGQLLIEQNDNQFIVTVVV